jgi:hypothetical protein
VLLGGGLPGSAPVTRRDSYKICDDFRSAGDDPCVTARSNRPDPPTPRPLSNWTIVAGALVVLRRRGGGLVRAATPLRRRRGADSARRDPHRRNSGDRHRRDGGATAGPRAVPTLDTRPRPGVSRFWLGCSPVGWPGGISPPGSHRSVRKPLGLYGSCRPGHQAEGIHFQCANIPGYRSVISCSLRWAGFDPRSRLYLLRIQRTR